MMLSSSFFCFCRWSNATSIHLMAVLYCIAEIVAFILFGNYRKFHSPL